MSLSFSNIAFIDQLSSMTRRVMSETFSGQAPKSLYHYTKPEHAQKIIASRELWATCLTAQKDLTELTNGINLVERIAVQMLDDEKNLFFRRVLAGLPDFMRMRKQWIFIACFCGIERSNVHMNTYGTSCFRFDIPRGLKPQLECHDCKANAWYSPVIYGEREQLKSTRGFLEALKPIVLRNLQGTPEDDRAGWLHKPVVRDAANCLLLLTACFKRKIYQQDREWRLLFMPNLALGSSAPSMSDEAFAVAIKLEPIRHIALRRKPPNGGPFGTPILRQALPFDEIIS